MYKLLFQIVQHDHQPLLSATACERLQLIRICNTISNTQQHTAAAITQKYAEVFEGHGNVFHRRFKKFHTHVMVKRKLQIAEKDCLLYLKKKSNLTVID
jgi:hypothetical protein